MKPRVQTPVPPKKKKKKRADEGLKIVSLEMKIRSYFLKPVASWGSRENWPHLGLVGKVEER
jgi:hypothetical protein